MLKALTIGVVATSFLTAPAIADVIAPNGRVIECFCTDTYGKRHELGDIICLTVGGRSFMAKCVMAQNVPFWRDQSHGCLSSDYRQPLPYSKPVGTLAYLHEGKGTTATRTRY